MVSNCTSHTPGSQTSSLEPVNGEFVTVVILFIVPAKGQGHRPVDLTLSMVEKLRSMKLFTSQMSPIKEQLKQNTVKKIIPN